MEKPFSPKFSPKSPLQLHESFAPTYELDSCLDQYLSMLHFLSPCVPLPVVSPRSLLSKFLPILNPQSLHPAHSGQDL